MPRHVNNMLRCISCFSDLKIALEQLILLNDSIIHTSFYSTLSAKKRAIVKQNFGNQFSLVFITKLRRMMRLYIITLLLLDLIAHFFLVL